MCVGGVPSNKEIIFLLFFLCSHYQYFNNRQSSAELFTSQRRDIDVDKSNIDRRILSYISGSGTKVRSREPVVYLPDSGQIVRAVAVDKVPKDAHTKGLSNEIRKKCTSTIFLKYNCYFNLMVLFCDESGLWASWTYVNRN